MLLTASGKTVTVAAITKTTRDRIVDFEWDVFARAPDTGA